MRPECIYASDDESPETYEKKLSLMGITWTVNATFRGCDSGDLESRRAEAERIINRFENEIDALIVQKRAELGAELCLICDELEID